MAPKLCANALVGWSANLEEEQPVGGGARVEEVGHCGCAFEECIRTPATSSFPLCFLVIMRQRVLFYHAPLSESHHVILSHHRLRNNGAKCP